MSKTIEGYVLAIDTAAGISAVPVTLYDANTGSPLAGVVGLTSNPVNTDGQGHFKFTMDLSPGPVYVDAAIPGGTHDRRYGLETMQVGDHWMSDLGTLLRAFTDGVVAGVLNEMEVSVSGSINQYTVATGDALIQGYSWTLESGSFSAAIDANPTLANRKSVVVLRQYTGGDYAGKQEIDILYGTVNNVAPSVRQGVTVGDDVIWEFPLATLNTAQNASVSTVLSDDREYSTLGMTILDGGVPVVGSGRKLDFSGNSFIITEESPGEALITPSFGTGAADFKRGNAALAGMVRGYVNSNTDVTGIGNAGETQIASVTVTLDPVNTYDVIVTGFATVLDPTDGFLIDAYIRCSLDIPFNAPASPGGAKRIYSNLSAFGAGSGEANFGIEGSHEWSYSGVSGVSSIKAYLFIKSQVSSATIRGYTLSAKFMPRI